MITEQETEDLEGPHSDYLQAKIRSSIIALDIEAFEKNGGVVKVIPPGVITKDYAVKFVLRKGPVTPRARVYKKGAGTLKVVK